MNYNNNNMRSVATIFSIAIFIVTAASLVEGQTCKFGPACRLACNCANLLGCNPQTGCVQRGKCRRGWDGPICQRRNVALDQQTHQSSNYKEKYSSRTAVDGTDGHDLIIDGCTHTRRENDPYWSVTLDRTYSIYSFQIYNRQGECQVSGVEKRRCKARLKGFKLSVGNAAQNLQTCYEDKTTSADGPARTINGTCKDGPIPGDTVNITLSGSDRVLSLCEVKILVCSPGTYGQECGQTCGSCAGQTACDAISGECPDGSPRCMAGFMGPKCDKQCTKGTYGAECSQACGACEGGSDCNISSGVCPDHQPRCAAGYSGLRCDTGCAGGRYGPDCGQECGSCDGGRTLCAETSGECPASTPRCMPGYSGIKCKTACSNKTWGPDCQNRCGQCHNNTSCSPTSGDCPLTEGNLRCTPGYSGSRCSSEDATEKQTGVIAGVVLAAIFAGIIVLVIVLIFRRRRQRATKRAARDVDEERSGHVLNELEPQENGVFQDEDDDVDAAQNEDPNPYVNVGMASKAVSVDTFVEYLSNKTSDEYKEEFEKFPVGLKAQHKAADKPQNKQKSRYKNLVAYDHSRVKLSTQSPKDSDYINACYIHGYNMPKEYIASQGPNDENINDFARMIWEQNAGKVVMVTNLKEGGKVKCKKYWPNTGTLRLGRIEVALQEEEAHANFTIRTLQLSHSQVAKSHRTVKQFHFTAWPDHGAPSHPSGLLEFRAKINSCKTPLKGPMVVHCSAGIGRTGTFIALDYLMVQANAENLVDVPACVFRLREQRVNMVQTQVQYVFLHEALAEALNLRDSSVQEKDYLEVYRDLCVEDETGRTKMAEQFEALEHLKRRLDDTQLTTARHPDNIHKNRSKEILAADTCRPFLSTPVPGGNNYINAIFLPAYKKKRGFILTQSPLPNTVVDFWRLVYDQGIRTIVMLDTIGTNEAGVGVYWPENRETFEPFAVELKDRQEGKDMSEWTYELSYKDKKTKNPIKQFRCKFWTKQPSEASISSLLNVLQCVATWQDKTGNDPVLVHCRDGFTICGLYCVISAVIERLKHDRVVSIAQFVKQMRVNRPAIITDLNQYHLLHEIVREYLESTHTYANFM